MKGGTVQQHSSEQYGAKEVVCAPLVDSKDAVFGHLAHWLDLLALSRFSESGCDLSRFLWCRQQILADRWNLKKLALKETNNFMAQLNLDEQVRWLDARMQATRGAATVLTTLCTDRGNVCRMENCSLQLRGAVDTLTCGTRH